MCQMASPSATFILESVVRGHHIYKRIWTPMLGEILQIELEETNSNDARAITVQKDGVIIGLLPRETARIIWYFLKRGSSGVWLDIGMLVDGRKHRRRLILSTYSCLLI